MSVMASYICDYVHRDGRACGQHAFRREGCGRHYNKPRRPRCLSCGGMVWVEGPTCTACKRVAEKVAKFAKREPVIDDAWRAKEAKALVTTIMASGPISVCDETGSVIDIIVAPRPARTAEVGGPLP